MTLQLDSWAVAGAGSSPQIARLMLTSATRSGNGIVEAPDMEVRELAVPGTSVRVGAGAAVALGKEAVFQGSYYAFNIGEEEVPVSPTDAGGGRSDLLILRVEDPNIDGTPWTHDPATDKIYYFRVIEGVAPDTTEVPAGTTGVALARIDIPVSTATITQDMIVDVRQVANPNRQRELRVMRGGGQEDGRDDSADYTADFERWPQHDWTVDIPAWATQVQVLAQWSNVWYPAPMDGTGGNYDARGQVRVGLIGGAPNNILTPHTEYNFNPTTATNGYRCSIGLAAQVDIPEEMRGTTVQLRMYAKSDADRIIFLRADGWSNFSCDLEFLEVAAPEAAP
ncbi:hypothetical protein [Nocardiopsis synnemataformans]|uniref:hypothetical protein n=1 Tax=Nocardiopsis synnemataformans TaxID=61305 RepID=UPI003EB74942